MKLIINADDLGMSKSITDGIIEGIDSGYFTSTSIMANMPYAEYAINKVIEHDIDCIGLHINLTLGKPIIYNANLVNDEGIFYRNKDQIQNPKLTYNDVYNEIMAQIEKVNEYSKGKIKLDHLNTHHVLVNNENIKKAIIDIANKLNLPVRNENYIGVKSPDVFYTEFSMVDVNIEALKKMILKYKDKNIIVELLTHPGYVDEYTKTVTSYIDRQKEFNVLKEAKETGIFEDIQLINFHQF